MRILILNPNMTEAVTQLMVDAGRTVASRDTELVPLTALRGFPYISSRAEAQIGGAIALEMLAEHRGGADAAIIAAFGDPGLVGARELFEIPVIGISEAAMLTACMLGLRFAFLTFAPALASWYRDCAEMHGLAGRCAGIHAIDQPFSAIDRVQEAAEEGLVALAHRAVEDGADVVILAGAPLAGLARRVAGRIPVPVIDPIAAAVKQAECLVALAPRKATAGALRRPDAKPAHGIALALARRIAHQDMPDAE
jgi:Asp/Glu/hydantoin racemase